MNLAQRINELITAQKPKAICDACVAEALDISHQQVNRVTMALETTRDFDRRRGICQQCGKEQKVICGF